MLKTSDVHRPELVIIDFGIAKSFTTSLVKLDGTPGYIPPETWTTGKWYPKGDCFSMGVTMYQMLTNTVPTDDGSQRGLFGSGTVTIEDIRYSTCTRPVNTDTLPGEHHMLKDMMSQLLQKDQSQRINAEQVQKHPWIASQLDATLRQVSEASNRLLGISQVPKYVSSSQLTSPHSRARAGTPSMDGSVARIPSLDSSRARSPSLGRTSSGSRGGSAQFASTRIGHPVPWRRSSASQCSSPGGSCHSCVGPPRSPRQRSRAMPSPPAPATPNFPCFSRSATPVTQPVRMQAQTPPARPSRSLLSGGRLSPSPSPRTAVVMAVGGYPAPLNVSRPVMQSRWA